MDEWVQSSIFGNHFGSATSDPFLQPASSPRRDRRRALPTPHATNAHLFFSTHDRTSIPPWCSPLRVPHTKLADEYLRTAERSSQRDEIGLDVQGKIAIQNIQASSFKPYRVVGGAPLCVVSMLECSNALFGNKVTDRDGSSGWQRELLSICLGETRVADAYVLLARPVKGAPFALTPRNQIRPSPFPCTIP